MQTEEDTIALSKQTSMNVHFIASDNFNPEKCKDVVKFVDNFPDFQTVILENENELKLLLELMRITDAVEYELHNVAFPKYWDISAFKLPEFTDEEFDEFYDNWLSKSHRDNNMDEYGNLIFLSG